MNKPKTMKVSYCEAEGGTASVAWREEMGEEWGGDSCIPAEGGFAPGSARLSTSRWFEWVGEGGEGEGEGGSPLCAAAETSLSG